MEVSLEMCSCNLSKPVAPLMQCVRATWKCKMAAHKGSGSLRLSASYQASITDKKATKTPFTEGKPSTYSLRRNKCFDL